MDAYELRQITETFRQLAARATHDEAMARQLRDALPALSNISRIGGWFFRDDHSDCDTPLGSSQGLLGAFTPSDVRGVRPNYCADGLVSVAKGADT